MGLALAVTVELEQFTCGCCGGVYAIAARYAKEKRDNAGFWHCPYCEKSWGFGEGATQKAERLLAAERARHALTLSRANQAEQENARLKRRVKRGVCPCCNRSFVALAKHIATKHPEYSK